MAYIMIIDDKPYMSSLVSEYLFRDGHIIKCFEDARSAMNELYLYRPDIVLLDLYLSGSEDWNTLHSIKMEYPELPVIIVSAYRNFLRDDRLEEADGYVIKSVGTDELKNKIASIITRQNNLKKNGREHGQQPAHNTDS